MSNDNDCLRERGCSFMKRLWLLFIRLVSWLVKPRTILILGITGTVGFITYYFLGDIITGVLVRDFVLRTLPAFAATATAKRLLVKLTLFAITVSLWPSAREFIASIRDHGLHAIDWWKAQSLKKKATVVTTLLAILGSILGWGMLFLVPVLVVRDLIVKLLVRLGFAATLAKMGGFFERKLPRKILQSVRYPFIVYLAKPLKRYQLRLRNSEWGKRQNERTLEQIKKLNEKLEEKKRVLAEQMSTNGSGKQPNEGPSTVEIKEEEGGKKR